MGKAVHMLVVRYNAHASHCIDVLWYLDMGLISKMKSNEQRLVSSNSCYEADYMACGAYAHRSGLTSE